MGKEQSEARATRWLFHLLRTQQFDTLSPASLHRIVRPHFAPANAVEDRLTTPGTVQSPTVGIASSDYLTSIVSFSFFSCDCHMSLPHHHLFTHLPLLAQRYITLPPPSGHHCDSGLNVPGLFGHFLLYKSI
jgi:hypothetical protein